MPNGNGVCPFLPQCLSVVPSKHMCSVVNMLKAIRACEDRQAALVRSEAAIEKLSAMRLREAATKVRDVIAEMLIYYSFPGHHWRRIGTNNPLEWIMREIRRRTRVVGAFTGGRSALMLATHIAGTQWGTKRYLTMELLRDLDALETHVA